MAFYDTWLDGALTRLGYTKATRSMAPVFAGEAPLAPLSTVDYTDEQRERLAVTSAWVYSDIRTIANEASTADVDVYRGKIEIEEHPFETLLEHPNQHMTASWMRQYTLWWLLLRGEAYWMKVYSRAGELAELWPLPSSRIQPIPDAQEYLAGFRYEPLHGREPIVFPVEQVVFFRLPNPFDFHRGLSPLTAYRLAVETDVAASEWNKRTFEDDVTLRMLISLPATVADPTYMKVKQEIVEELVERRRRYLIARAGDVTATPLSVSHKDLEFLAGREFTREEIDRVFGIPAGFWAKEATKANSDAAKMVLIEQAVWPLLVLMGETITTQVLQRDYDAALRCGFEDIREKDRAQLVQERRVYWQVQTVNEARQELGLAPIADDLGETLVPLATRGSGGPPGPEAETAAGIGPQLPSVEGANADEEYEAGMARDLKTWEGIARRRVRAGESAAYAFESEYIPGWVRERVLEGLRGVGTEEEVRAVFAAGFWGYP